MRTITSLIIITALIACNNGPTITLEVKDYDITEGAHKSIKSEPVDFSTEIFGVDDIFMCDSLLIFQTTDPSGFLKIYNVNNHKKYNLCTKGRSSNEFMSASTLSGQYYKLNSDLIIPVNDGMNNMKEINLTESIRKGRTTIVSISESMETFNNGMNVILDSNKNKRFCFDNAQRNEIYNDEIDLPNYYITNNGRKTKKIKVFRNKLNLEREIDAISYHFGCLYKHPSKNIIIQAFQHINYIIYFDVDNNHYYAIHGSGTISFDDYIKHESKMDFCFVDACCNSPDFFIVLLNSQKTPLGQTQNSRLLFFDWSGNYIGCAETDVKINRIALDSTNRVLYGLRIASETIVSFDLNDFINGIYEK